MLVDASKVIATSVALAERERTLRAARRGRNASMEGSPDRIAALVEASTALERAGVHHALIGGVAVGIHSGVARATEDVDLAIASTADLAAVVAVMERAGFRAVGRFEHSANFRHASGEPVQLAFDPGFDAMIERAERIAAGGVSIPIVRKGDLIAMKERAAADPARRPSKAHRDRADVELLRGDVSDPDEGW